MTDDKSYWRQLQSNNWQTQELLQTADNDKTYCRYRHKKMFQIQTQQMVAKNKQMATKLPQLVENKQEATTLNLDKIKKTQQMVTEKPR